MLIKKFKFLRYLWAFKSHRAVLSWSTRMAMAMSWPGKRFLTQTLRWTPSRCSPAGISSTG